MRMKWAAIIGAVSIAAFAAPTVQADSIGGVEGARAKERQGRYLNRIDREHLRHYGGNDDYGWRGRYRDYDYGYYDDYDDGPGVSVYVGPGGVGVYGY
ncbi:MAG TPA: hypothetical protein PKE16_04680 [Hyphomicrobium sp.]|nr:hypothetical protein [Hyphomicrobium sp.]